MKGDKQMNTRTLDQKNDYYGQAGTPERDRIERELEALRIGFKIRNAREKTHLHFKDRERWGKYHVENPV